MAAPQFFRLSSFFFGRAGSGRAAADASADASAAVERSGLSELEQSLLDRADVDLECGYDDKFVFSWRRLLLHMGCALECCVAPWVVGDGRLCRALSDCCAAGCHQHAPHAWVAASLLAGPER